MPESIAEFNEVKLSHKFLQPTVPFKEFRGYKEAPFFPKVTPALGSELNTGIGMNRTGGNCRWKASYDQKPLFRDPKVRLQFPYLQGNVVDVPQNPPKTYGEYSQRVSPHLVL